MCSVGSGGLLFGYDFIKLIKNALVSGKVEWLVSNFKKMQDMILLSSALSAGCPSLRTRSQAGAVIGTGRTKKSRSPTVINCKN